MFFWPERASIRKRMGGPTRAPRRPEPGIRLRASRARAARADALSEGARLFRIGSAGAIGKPGFEPVGCRPLMTTGRLESIFLFPRSRAPGRAVESVEACASKGLLGDRRRGVKRQVTLLAAEDWAAAVGEVGGMAPAEDRRANLLVSGLP